MLLNRRLMMMGSAALAAASSNALSSDAADALPDAMVAEIDQAVADAMSAGACPGAQVAIAGRKEIIFSRAYGVGNLKRKSRISGESTFRIGSLTKQFTAAAIIRLAEQGKVKREAPASTYLPAFAKVPPFTLLELMHHTAGLHADESDTSPTRAGKTPKNQIALASEIALQKKLFDFDPGTAWRYSNANYIVLGAVIEAVTKMPLAKAASQLIFNPLDLKHTAFDRTSAPTAGQVIGYAPQDSKTISFMRAPFVEISDAGGAGAMRSTAGDLCAWHRALLGQKLFARDAISLMLAPGKLRDGRLSGANRFSPDDAQYGDTQYACGLLVSGPSEPHRNILHYSAINGFACVLQTWLESGVTMAILTNGDMGPSVPFRAIRQSVLKHLIESGG